MLWPFTNSGVSQKACRNFLSDLNKPVENALTTDLKISVAFVANDAVGDKLFVGFVLIRIGQKSARVALSLSSYCQRTLSHMLQEQIVVDRDGCHDLAGCFGDYCRAMQPVPGDFVDCQKHCPNVYLNPALCLVLDPCLDLGFDERLFGHQNG